MRCTGFLASVALGETLADPGGLEDAARWYERALRQPVLAERSGGVTTGYTWLVFDREAIFDRFLPDVVQRPVIDDEVETMRALGSVGEQLRRMEDAAHTYRALLDVVPDVAEAKERPSALP